MLPQKHLTYYDLHSQLKELKDTEGDWLRQCCAQSLQSSLRNLENAYDKFFKGNGFPNFKSRHGKQSIHFPQIERVDFKKNTIFLPKLKNVSCVFHRQFDGKVKTVTVSKTVTGKYFVSILVDNQKKLPKKRPVTESTAVGIDMGIKTLATLSDGTLVENPRFFKRQLTRLRVEKRKLSRRFKKGVNEQSKRYHSQKLVVARLHEHIRNQREDYLHKASTRIVHSFDTICLEDLNVKGLMKNRNLSLAIGDIGWYKFKTMLEYKAEWNGKNILYIGRFEPSSKLCSHCGSIFKELSLKDRSWTCQSCGTNHDRDANAAQNIKVFGLRNKPSTVNVSH